RPVRTDERSLRQPGRLQDRFRPLEPRRLDDDVRALDDLAHALEDANRLAERLLELAAERLARHLAPARDADLGEVEERIQEDDVPVGGAARADVAEDLRVTAREILGADRGQRTGSLRR